MSNTDKIFRDPLYNYITVNKSRDGWLVELLDTLEVQRLRRIHQLGVSCLTYPGADHSRLSHTLGVSHLMQQALKRVESIEGGPGVERARHVLMAAAILHDVGHGPFSHLFEPALGIDHEHWSCQIVGNDSTEVNQVLKRHDIPHEQVIALIKKADRGRPPWQKTLLSSELDVDRLDYLRRDSYFTGSGYGHYDWYRVVSSFELHDFEGGSRILVWPDSAKYAIEEYIFSRFYMYNNVYQHKTTRGFEKLIQAAWQRAKDLLQQGIDPGFIVEIGDFLLNGTPSVCQYLALEDATLVYQVKQWSKHDDRILANLSRRLLARAHLSAIEDPVTEATFDDTRKTWEKSLTEIVADKGFEPTYYMLRDDLKLTIYDPYIPEREEREQDPYNAIFILVNGKPREISSVLERLAAVTGAREKRYRYYVPEECRDAVHALATSRKW